ncbi:MAG: amidohydrolase family protein, partial [Isosphaeraceae bacterium]
MKTVVDSHQHFWDLSQPFNYDWLKQPDLEPIRRNFLPEDLRPLMRQTGVARSIVVQTQHDLRENDWALNLAAQHDWIAGVVGWVDLASPDCESQVRAARSNPKFVGVRHITQDEPDDDFLVGTAVLRGLGVLEKLEVPFDLLLYVRHLRHVPTLAARFPGLKLVIDHLAKPEIKSRRFEEWLPLFRVAAHQPNVFCKLSGMVTEASWADWRASDLTPYVQAALDAFGPSRLMFGSDWPVCNLAGSYEQVHEALVTALGE